MKKTTKIGICILTVTTFLLPILIATETNQLPEEGKKKNENLDENTVFEGEKSDMYTKQCNIKGETYPNTATKQINTNSPFHKYTEPTQGKLINSNPMLEPYTKKYYSTNTYISVVLNDESTYVVKAIYNSSFIENLPAWSEKPFPSSEFNIAKVLNTANKLVGRRIMII